MDSALRGTYEGIFLHQPGLVQHADYAAGLLSLSFCLYTIMSFFLQILPVHKTSVLVNRQYDSNHTC